MTQHKLFNLPVISTESGETIKELQNVINYSLSALKLHTINVSNWGCILIFLCSVRLTEQTLCFWEQSVRDKTEIPRWEDFEYFLTTRFHTLETISDFRTNSLPIMTNQTNVSLPPCKLCPMQYHRPPKCPKFLRMKA